MPDLLPSLPRAATSQPIEVETTASASKVVPGTHSSDNTVRFAPNRVKCSVPLPSSHANPISVSEAASASLVAHPPPTCSEEQRVRGPATHVSHPLVSTEQDPLQPRVPPAKPSVSHV